MRRNVSKNHVFCVNAYRLLLSSFFDLLTTKAENHLNMIFHFHTRIAVKLPNPRDTSSKTRVKLTHGWQQVSPFEFRHKKLECACACSSEVTIAY